MHKNPFSMLSAAFGLFAAVISADAKVIAHFNGNGAFADVVTYSEKGKAGLNVSESRSSGTTTTNLSYYSSGCDPVAGVCEGISAFGPIPGSDFHATEKSASVATNTTANPDFKAVKWTYNSGTNEYAETPISLGYVNVTWTSSGVSTYKSIGTTTHSDQVTTQKSTGQSSWADAVATGVVGGISINGSYATIGTNSNNEITIERK